MLKRTSFSTKIIALLLFFLCSCGEAGDLLDIALDPPSRKPIDKSIVGINNFFVNNEFGSISEQYTDINSNLGLKFYRVLFAWTDDVQPTPSSPLNFSFYDQIALNIPAGADVLVVLTHQPSWMADPANWTSGNARSTWVDRFLKPLVARYGSVPRINGFEIFNEPDVVTVPADSVLELQTPANYFELLKDSYFAIKSIAPSKLAVMAATTSIQRNFPTILDYNRTLRDLGGEGYTDIWNVHYYATSYESVVTNNGVADFLNSVSRPIWVTESGEQGPNKQLAYVETAWPFLKEKIPGIQRFYYYQYGETGPIETNFGLRTTDPSFPVSDLYIHFRDGTR